ncbi:COX15/CtaA family protein [Methylotetracoccus oryzae]|uniref:COX15/CtaA family protein n=1 Tax=Methylotetracoccus oryzae TaxID=1919059 RepID=UPI0013A56A54|nr:COX15/CtaA family protein [Methylotetracoccus oryzae]
MVGVVRALALIAVILTLATIALGAYVRSADTESRCAPWPACVQQPDSPPDRSLRAGASGRKTAEMMARVRLDIKTHRYVAGAVGLSVLLLASLVWTLPDNRPKATFWAMASVCMVVMQTALGLWTLEHALLPLAVTAHLLLGYSILLALFLTHLAVDSKPRAASSFGGAGPGRRWAARIALLLLLSQLLVGGWTSTHQAGLACSEIPACLQQLWPESDQISDFAWGQQGASQNGLVWLPEQQRAAIHWAHRISGLLLGVALTLIAVIMAWHRRDADLRPAALLLGLLVLATTGTGIAAVMFRLPVTTVVAHTLLAGLSLLSLVYLSLRLEGRV